MLVFMHIVRSLNVGLKMFVLYYISCLVKWAFVCVQIYRLK